MDYWASCTECVFETNSLKQTIKHAMATGHLLTEESEDGETERS